MKKLALNALILPLCLGLWGVAWTAAQTKKEVTVKTEATTELERGKKLFETNCASCHGKDGKGSGPVAVAMKAPPTDLSQIAKKNQGKFDEVHVMAFVDGEKAISAHGTREMPVWGTRFRRSKGSMESSLNIYVLMKYIESLQEK
ncbi:MAG: c-type cytochrome [Acidobacteriia bacterium]|nr:c-type cytochrome [Terriglobia bacterium]